MNKSIKKILSCLTVFSILLSLNGCFSDRKIRLNNDENEISDSEVQETEKNTKNPEASSENKTQNSNKTQNPNKTQNTQNTQNTQKNSENNKSQQKKVDENKLYQSTIQQYASLNASSENNTNGYFLYDLNRDGIKELIIKYMESDCEAGGRTAAFTISGSNVVELTNPDYASVPTIVPVSSITTFSKPSDGNGILADYSHNGNFTVSRITMNGNSIKAEQISGGKNGQTISVTPLPKNNSNNQNYDNSYANSSGYWNAEEQEIAESLYPYSCVNDMTNEDIQFVVSEHPGKIAGECADQMLINEIYAKHGYQFSTPAIQKYFESKGFYVNKHKSMQQVSNELSAVEQRNIKKIKNYHNNHCK